MGGVLCGRHTLVRKNGIGDLQEGERFVSNNDYISLILTQPFRFANMDFIIFSAIYMSLLLLLTFSYDICCQWSRNLLKRVPQLPTALQPPADILRNAKLVLPKFHLHNHGLKCQLNFNLNFLRGSAQSDLEDPERYWAHSNPVSMSTREMSEGARHDTLSDHAGSWNWRKIVNFGESSFSYCAVSLLITQWSCRFIIVGSSQNVHPHASSTPRGV